MKKVSRFGGIFIGLVIAAICVGAVAGAAAGTSVVVYRVVTGANR